MGGTAVIKPGQRAPVRVLFIAGTGRSGSTLLAGILGQIDGVFNAGEVRYIWDRGLAQNRLCGCGKHFRDCPLWQRILEEAGPLDPAEMSRIQARLTRVRHLPGLAAGRDGAGGEAGKYRAGLARLYRAAADVNGASVVVDSSKLPSYGRLLSSIPDIDLHVVQLVRDPRAAAGSWAGIKDQPDRGVPGTMQRMSPAQSALLWNLWNTTSKGFVASPASQYMTLRYEDFIARPLDSVRKIAAMLGRGDAELPFIDARTVELAPNHTVAGNPDRLRAGPVSIRADAGSKNRLSKRDELLVTALTLPVLVRFGYPLAPRVGGRAEPIGIQHLPAPIRTLRRLQRHWRWGRQEGFGRLVEEDQLDPRTRLAAALRRREWRRTHPVRPGSTTPLFLVGLQRSGTNMVARALEANPEFELRNENDRAAFDRFRLRPLPVVRELVLRSRQHFVVFKPLIDSHRVDELLAELNTPSPGKALWTYRSVDGRVRSALAKFGDHDLQVLRAIAEGRAGDIWQAQRLPAESYQLVKSLDLDSITPETAAAVIWHIRNSLYFELGLDSRDDCLLISYDRVLDDPAAEIRRICEFTGAEYGQEMIAGIGRRGGRAERQLQLDPLVRVRCAELEQRLEAACAGPVRV